MPTPKYRLVEVIIHEGESAYAGHYLSVNLETKEVFNDQFPNRKYMKYSEFSQYEAKEKYGHLPRTPQVKDMMKKMIDMSSEDVEDSLIKLGNIFYYRREAKSSSNPVTDQMETKSEESETGTPTISFKKIHAKSVDNKDGEEDTEDEDPGALNPKFLMTNSQVSEVKKRIDMSDDDIGKLLDDINTDIDTTNFSSMYDKIKLSPRKDIITPKKSQKEEQTSKPKITPKGKKETWITTPNKKGEETLQTPEKVEVKNTPKTPKKDIKSRVTDTLSKLSPKKLNKEAESTPNKERQEREKTPEKAVVENTPKTPKKDINSLVKDGLSKLSNISRHFTNKDAESTPNKEPQDSSSNEENLIDEMEIDKVIYGPLLERQCTCSINGIPCIKCGINPVCHFCSQMRRRDECNNCAFQKVIFSPIKIPQSTPKKKIQPTSIETHKMYHKFQENNFQSMEEAGDTGQNLLVTLNKPVDLSTPSKSSRKDDIHEVATSKTFVAGAESPALKRTMKNKKDADESTSSCPVCKNSEHYCKICKRRCCALCKVSGELNNHICKSCSKPHIPDQDPDNG